MRQGDSREDKPFSKQNSKQEIGKTKWQQNKMDVKNKHVSILTLNINGLNAPIKRYRIGNWAKNEDPTIWCL
jgi:hypothetical protein